MNPRIHLPILALLLASCTIVPSVPERPLSGAISHNKASDYFVAWVKDDKGNNVGAIVEDAWVVRYNAYATKYGASFTPSIEQYHPPGNVVDVEHFVYWKNLRDAPLRGVKEQSLLQKIGL